MTRYERLLRLYPKDYRNRYGAELLETLAETGRSRVTESLNLVGGAIVAQARRFRLAERAPWHDAFAITSLLAPILLMAGAADGMHEIGWLAYYGVPLHANLTAFTDGGIWLAWPILLVLGLFRLRRTTMVLGWLAAAATVVVLNERFHGFEVIQSPTGVAGWSLLAILAAATCTASDGIRRGYDLVGRPRTLLTVAAVLLALAARVLGHNFTVTYLATLVIALACALYAAWRARPTTGWQVTALLATPILATASTLWLYRGAPPFGIRRFGLLTLPHAVYEYGFALIVLALVVLTWRIAARINNRKTETG